jgi:molybdopterin converting factor subunit 1
MAGTVRVLYFAALRDLVGLAEERLEVPEGAPRVLELSQAIERRHPELGPRLASVRFAVNEAFVSLEDPVAPGDTVALIPPVSGG